MDNHRVILFVALSFVFLLLWQAWQEDFTTPPPAVSQQAPGAPTDTPAPPGDVVAPETVPGVPETAAPQPEVTAGTPADLGLGTFKSGQRIIVKTDVVEAEIDTVGGDIRVVKLLDYPIKADEPDKPLALLSDKQPPIFIAQTGLLSSGSAPDHHAIFTAKNSTYTLKPGAAQVVVPLTWTNEDGVEVTKTFTFKRGEYLIEVDQRVANNATENWQGRQYRQFQRSSQASPTESSFIYTYTGGVIYSEENKYEKIQFDDMEDENLGRSITGGWAAMIQHYFVGAWVPDQNESNYFYSKAPGNDRYILGMVSPEKTVAPGETAHFASQVYAGPKTQETLEAIAPGLELTVDYGWLTVISKPLFWLLSYIHDVIATGAGPL
jgi:YidC/Oxa1 family membrane protein insertase